MDISNRRSDGKDSRPHSPGENITHDSMNVIKKIEESGDKMDTTAQMIDDSESQLKERILQCKKVIDSLKLELKEEKFKLGKDSRSSKSAENMMNEPSSIEKVYSPDMLNMDYSFSSKMFSTCIERKLNCDENLMAYEKQLQKYQQTLNMAQTEKKNAIRKRMLAKAFKLKLLEIENQCNVELLRVKQSLQCLEPLKLIADQWKSNPDNAYDINSFDLIPRYPELGANSGSDINSLKKFEIISADGEENDVYEKTDV